MKVEKLVMGVMLSLIIVGCGGSGGSGGDANTGGTNLPPSNTEPPSVTPTTPFTDSKYVYDGDTIGVGNFFGAGINYYNFNMPKKGNLVMHANSAIDLYDSNLNKIGKDYQHDWTQELEAGDYIIKFDHGTSGYTYTLTLNSNVSYDQYKLPLINRGKQIDIGFQYYRINMPIKGKLMIDANSAVYLYDINLNQIGDYYTQHTVELEAGDYVIGFDHEGRRSYGYNYSFTLNSNVW